MKYLNVIILFCLSAFVLSCDDDEKQRQAETLRATKVNDSILKVISDNWKFDVPPLSEKVAMRVSTWNEWQLFKSVVESKPTGSINAYREKTKGLIFNVDRLTNNMPSFVDKPQVRSRIGVLSTKIKSLYTYINLEVIPDKKVVALIKEIAREITSLQNQFDEIVRFSEIPKEIGEDEMLKALDTVRMANPEPKQPEIVQPRNRRWINNEAQPSTQGVSRDRGTNPNVKN